MELILISDSKLKIMMTGDDMKAYALDCKTLDYDNTETRRAFWSILDEAKHRTGFDAASERVFVQVYPSRCGGCEMYVTKLGLPYDGEETEESLPPAEETRGGSAVNHSVMPSKMIKREPPAGRKASFRFADAQGLLCVCRQLMQSGYAAPSEAYRAEDGHWYLVLRDEGPARRLLPGPLSFIAEFAEEIPDDTLASYIPEHGECLCGTDAVHVLGVL